MYQQNLTVSVQDVDKSDSFSSIADKYKFLLGLNDSSKVLLVGSTLIEEYYNDFKLVFNTVNILDCNELEQLTGTSTNIYDVIYFDYREILSANKNDITSLLTKLKSSLAEKGVILLFVNNFLSKKNIKNTIRFNNLDILKSSNYIKSPFINGFYYVCKFAASSDVIFPDEYSTISVNKNGSRLAVFEFLKQKYFENFLCDTHLYLLSKCNSNYYSDTQKIILNNIRVFLSSCLNSFYLKKYYLRSRGTLLLIYKNRETDQSLVCRVSVTDKTTEVISRNKKVLQDMFNIVKSSDYLSNKIPMFVGEFNVGKSSIFIETMQPGVLAWKLSNNSRIFTQYIKSAAQFVQAFNLRTKSYKVIDDACFKLLIGKDLNLLYKAFEYDEDIKLFINNIYCYLYKYFIGKEVSIVLGHGDFGPGNILCSRIDGCVTGIIDWDTYVKYELPCVDLLNLEIQNLITKEKLSLAEALIRLNNGLSMSSKDTQIESLKYYDEVQFGIAFNDLNYLMIITVIRYIKRSLPYIDEFVVMKEEYKKALQLANLFLDK